jgi:protein involved in polysaccharide export with SLBB domain
LGPGDLVELKFNTETDLNDKVTVRPDGAISLAMVGELNAKGLTPAELSRQLTEKYRKYLKHPDVTVIVREFAGQKVYVGGEVNIPGVVNVLGSLTCLQALFNAGGPKPSASLSSAVLMRYDGDNRTEVKEVDLEEIFKGKASDITLQSYDVLFIPRSRISKLGLFVQQYVNDLVPRSLMFPYNLNSVVSVKP